MSDNKSFPNVCYEQNASHYYHASFPRAVDISHYCTILINYFLHIRLADEIVMYTWQYVNKFTTISRIQASSLLFKCLNDWTLSS